MHGLGRKAFGETRGGAGWRLGDLALRLRNRSKTERCRSNSAKMSKASTTMKQLQMSPGEMAQISTLISNLTRSVELLHFDIDFEEERARIRDLSDPAYPILARHLRTRRENLMETIAALEARAGGVGPLGDGQKARLAS
jgi:hypothetical protein